MSLHRLIIISIIIHLIIPYTVSAESFHNANEKHSNIEFLEHIEQRIDSMVRAEVSHQVDEEMIHLKIKNACYEEYKSFTDTILIIWGIAVAVLLVVIPLIVRLVPNKHIMEMSRRLATIEKIIYSTKNKKLQTKKKKHETEKKQFETQDKALRVHLWESEYITSIK